MSTAKQEQPIRTFSFPEVALPYIEPQNLPPHEQAWIEQRENQERRKAVAQRAHQTLKEWITKNKRYPTICMDETTQTINWEDDTQIFKNALNDYPEVAVAVYLSWKTGWLPEEIVDVASRDTRAALALALKDPTTDIAKLQNAMEPDPKMAYIFARDVPNADATLASYQTEKYPYWNFLITHYIQKDPDRARTDLRLRIPYSPEAASTWLRLHPNNEDELKICLKCLQTDSFWSYMTALTKKEDWKPDAGEDNNEDDNHAAIWKSLRDCALKSPQWAYHWWRDIEPENVHINLDTVAYHPGWAAQTIQDVSAPRGKLSKVEMLIIVDGMIRNIFPQDDPYYTTFIFWGADLVSETTDKAPDVKEDTDEEDEDEFKAEDTDEDSEVAAEGESPQPVSSTEDE